MRTLKPLRCVNVALWAGLAFGCNNDPDLGAPATLQFTERSYTFWESDGVVNIPLSLSTAQFGYVETTFGYNLIGENTLEETDVNIFTSPVTLYGGTQEGEISLSILDDDAPDGNDTIAYTLDNVTGNASLASGNSSTRVIIRDDDTVPPGEMWVHVSWYGERFGARRMDYDLNLFLFTDVVFQDNVITSYKIFKESRSTTGFEHIVLSENDPDQEYYIIVNHRAHAQGLDDEPVNGKIKLSGFGHRDDGENQIYFHLPAVGYYSYVGPFKKEGRNFVLQK